MRGMLAAVALTLVALPARADDPPDVEFQPVPCTIAGNPISLCAGVSDDIEVAKARIYFRAPGDDYYSYVDMTFGGIDYCGTLPAPREGKLKSIEYYVQAVDSGYQTKRTSTYQMLLQPEGVCGFPPIEKDPQRAGSIVVHATHKKQGSKLPKPFDPLGVTFVPFGQ